MVENEKVVKVIYDLYVDGQKAGTEELMERATEEHPLVYCHGENMMLPKFEEGLAGKEAGDSFDFRIPCADAYGEYDTEGVKELDKALFEIDGKFDEERVFVGNIVPMTTVEGQIVNAQIAEITADKVTIDLNHPLAGENLHFTGKILEIRDASEAELKAIRNRGCHCGCHGDKQCGGCDGEQGCGSCGNGCGE